MRIKLSVYAALAIGLAVVQSICAGTVSVDATRQYQTIEGFGGAIAFYDGWVPAHPYKLEIYTNAFAGLGLSMLRLGDWYRYNSGFNSSSGEGGIAGDIVSNANRSLGHPVSVYMSSWSPPASLKSNGQVGNGGTLITNSDGSFAYTNFAQYWSDSLKAYGSNGVTMTWISIQNEPDWVAGYDSCIFHPTEDTLNGTNYASYSKALDAVYQRLTNLPAPPKILAPEPVHIAYNDLTNYAATMNSNSFYGVAYHLYGNSAYPPDSTPDGYTSDLTSSAKIFPAKPHFMTEFGYPDMIQTACLIHNCLTIGQDSGFNYWSLVWPVGGVGLVQIENPYNMSSWTNAPAGVKTQSHGWWLTPAYWGMKHFSYYVQPGYRRVSASDNDSNVRSSAYVSPDGLRLVVVLINTNTSVSSAMSLSLGTFAGAKSSVFQTAGTNTYAGTNTFVPLGSLSSPQILPPLSLTTVVLDQVVVAGTASNPSPADGTLGVALNSSLSWTPGSNALAHAVYLGTDSNAVSQASLASPQFQGSFTSTNFYPALAGGTSYFWRVDEMVGANSSTGAVWSFTTASTPLLLHRYSFSDTGTNVADSVGGPAWNGTLPNGGTLGGGQLILASSSQQYVLLPAGVVGGLSNFTIAAWVQLASTSNWARIFDFGNNTTVYMFLAPQNGSTGKLRYAITTGSNGAEQQINCNSVLSTGVWHQVAVTLNATTGILYLDGVAVGTNNAMTLNPSSLGSTTNNYVGKSQWSDPYLNGSIDEFRIHSVALSPAEIAATYALGPNILLSTNSPAISLTPTGSNLVVSWPLPSAGFMVQSSTNLALDNWLTVTSPPPQILGGLWQATLLLPTNSAAMFYRLVK